MNDYLSLIFDLIEAVNNKTKEAYEKGRAEAAEQSDDAEAEAYNEGYNDGEERGYDEGYNDGAADSYDDGYEDGAAEAYLRAAEAAAFSEKPRVHNWVEGSQFD
jgi:flagellar biosynthesis/type III secretory pathway protein FliH